VEDASLIIPGVASFLFFGAIFMTQMPRHWQTTGGWLFISLVGIPLFILFVGLIINVPALLFGGLVLTGFFAGQPPRRRRR